MDVETRFEQLPIDFGSLQDPTIGKPCQNYAHNERPPTPERVDSEKEGTPFSTSREHQQFF
jgi:hypothetical protein